MIWKLWHYLTNERGQVAFNNGGLWSGIGQGLAQLGQNVVQGKKLKEQQKALDLRNKMLQMQLDEAAQADQARQALFQAITQPAQQSIFANTSEEGAGVMPGNIPAPTRPQTVEELRQNPEFLGNLARAQPKEFAGQILKNMFPTASGTLHGGFNTPQEALESARASGMPVARIRQLGTGLWVAEGSEPVNYGALLAQGAKARVLQAGGTPQDAEAAGQAALNAFNYQQGALNKYGQVEGGAAATLGTPIPTPPGSPATTIPSTPAPSTMSSQGTTQATPPKGPFPTPAGGPTGGGESLAIQAERAKRTVARQEQALPEGETTVIAQGGVLDKLVNDVKSTVKPEYLGNPLAGDTELEARRRLGGRSVLGMTVPGAVGPDELVFRNNLRNMQNLIVYLQTGKQINETEAKRLNAALPQPYEGDLKQFNASVDNFASLVRTIIAEHAKAAGVSRGGVGGAVPAGPQMGQQPKQILHFNPATGRIE